MFDPETAFEKWSRKSTYWTKRVTDLDKLKGTGNLIKGNWMSEGKSW
jgi:hypothetical protein